MSLLQILIVDDHEVVRRGVRDLIRAHPGWEVCGEAVNGLDALEKAAALEPDIVVMDISMPKLNGLQATRLILKAMPRTKVLILTMHDSMQLLEEAIKVGAKGYVLKSVASSDLADAIEAVSKQQVFFVRNGKKN